MDLRLRGPEYLPLKSFRYDDLLDPGANPLLSVIGAMSDPGEGERLVSRMKPLSLGPDWARQHQGRTQHRQPAAPASSSQSGQDQFNTKQAASYIILGVTALVGLRGYFWVQNGETWKAELLGLGVAEGLALRGGPGAHQEVPLRGRAPGPAYDQGKGHPTRLPSPTGGHRHPARARHRAAGQGHPAQRERGLPPEQRRGALVVVDEMESMPGVDYESVLSELGKFGASFILATQSLARLADLSPTMQDTLLANVGWLAVFQVAASDARELMGELDRDRVGEEDLVSLSAHQCYVRITHDGQRQPTFTMMVRKPEPGDPGGGGAGAPSHGGLHPPGGDGRRTGPGRPGAVATVPGADGAAGREHGPGSFRRQRR